ncbi:MAG: 30S ribosomal protein S6 [Planctomycetota bacterium]|nr:30S ribosomal protein S6 [Planctomycetota bacterium]
MPRKTDSRVYEAMFLVDSGDAAAWSDLAKHLANILTRSGAEIIGITRWDERKLAYTIRKRKRGTYVLGFFVLQKGDAVVEIERDCRLSEKVLRCIILRADHFTVANMRMQLGEDVHEDVAQRLFIERGEEAAAAAAAAVVAKPAGAGETAVAAEAAPPPERTVEEPPDDLAEETETP